jgi:hypothetical protein
MRIRGCAATTAVGVAIAAEHPSLHLPVGSTRRLRGALQEILERGVRNADREYLEAYLARKNNDAEENGTGPIEDGEDH